MSSAELKRAAAPKHLGQKCRGRKARFRYRGVVCHTLCCECFRRERDRAPGAASRSRRHYRSRQGQFDLEGRLLVREPASDIAFGNVAMVEISGPHS